ncbi:MAG: hypothetical protein WBC69_12860, partial [Geitlerinemataceae cyanobacterium]
MNLTNLLELLQQQWFLYALALAVGFPLTILVLGELIHRYRKRGKSVSETLSIVRNLVVPIWVVLLFCKYVLELNTKSNSIKLLETLFW